MSIPVPLRGDFDAPGLRRLARSSKDANQARRLLALATIYAGGTRSEAAAVGGVGLQIVRDWVVRFNADGPAGLLDRKAPGQPPLLKDEHRRALGSGLRSRKRPWGQGVPNAARVAIRRQGAGGGRPNQGRMAPSVPAGGAVRHHSVQLAT